MLDIYDGEMWQNFLSAQGRPFLSQPNNLALSLNVDWFRPFKHSQYGVGIVYFCILNLPREIRYLPQNIIVAGIIPGPKEPEKVMNTYLEPLVDDLKKLWNDVYIEVPTLAVPVRVRAALLCVTCDKPACRKVCGFLGHNSNRACSKCLHVFPGDVSNGFDFSGYDVIQWPEWEIGQHRDHVNLSRAAQTASARNSLESEHGSRYSVLLDLSYFDIVHQHVIDPMHNLFLGIAKHTVLIWKERYWSSGNIAEKIQEIVNRFQVPSSVGRIPHQILTGFSSFTADQWKHWVLIYSLIVVEGRIPSVDYSMWTKFVQTCSIVCSPVLHKEAITRAHQLFIEFCTEFQDLYGGSVCTINMHLSCHLHTCLHDYGPCGTYILVLQI